MKAAGQIILLKPNVKLISYHTQCVTFWRRRSRRLARQTRSRARRGERRFSHGWQEMDLRGSTRFTRRLRQRLQFRPRWLRFLSQIACSQILLILLPVGYLAQLLLSASRSGSLLPNLSLPFSAALPDDSPPVTIMFAIAIWSPSLLLSPKYPPP